jgi:hypothetical protein
MIDDLELHERRINCIRGVLGRGHCGFDVSPPNLKFEELISTVTDDLELVDSRLLACSIRFANICTLRLL